MEGLWLWDRWVFRSIHLGWHSQFLDAFFAIISASGLGYHAIPILLLLPVVRKQFGTRSTNWFPASWFWPMAVCFTASGLLNGLVFKNLIVRERPSNFDWALSQEPYFHDSFASGHTTTSFAIASFVFIMTRGTRWNWHGWLFLLWATLVGISRIYRGVHWPTDVIAGAFIGTLFAAACSMWAFRLEEKNSDFFSEKP